MRLKTSLGIAIGTALGTLVAARALRSRRAIELAGKTVVIFGGSRGLGLVMARQLASEGARSCSPPATRLSSSVRAWSSPGTAPR